MFSHDPEVGVKCMWTRGVLRQPGLDVGVLVGGVVVAHDVQLDSRVGLGDLLEEGQELLVGVLLEAPVGDQPGRDLERSEQGGGAVAFVVVGLLLRYPRPQGHDRRSPVQRLVWVFSSMHTTTALAGGAR